MKEVISNGNYIYFFNLLVVSKTEDFIKIFVFPSFSLTLISKGNVRIRKSRTTLLTLDNQWLRRLGITDKLLYHYTKEFISALFNKRSTYFEDFVIQGGENKRIVMRCKGICMKGTKRVSKPYI